MLKLSRQKNALIGGLLGGVGGGQLVLEALDAYTNVHLTTRQGALVAGGVSTVVLFAGRGATYLFTNGIRGAWRRIMDGKAGAQPHDVGGAPGAATLPLADLDVRRIAVEVITQLQPSLERLLAGPSDTTPADEPDPGGQLDEHAAPPEPLPSTQP